MNITTTPTGMTFLDGSARAEVVMNALYQYACLSGDWFDALDMATHMAHEELQALTDDSNDDDLDYAHGLAEGVEQLRRIASERAGNKLGMTFETAAAVVYGRR